MDNISPAIYEAQAKRRGKSQRIIPHFFRIGANSGQAFKIGRDTFSELLLKAGEQQTITFQTSAKGFYRFLSISANAKILRAGKFHSTYESELHTQPFDNAVLDRKRRKASYLQYISAILSIGSNGIKVVGGNQRSQQNNVCFDANLQTLNGNFFYGNEQIPQILGAMDTLTLTLRNNAPFDIYLSGLIIGYRIIA